MLITAGRFHVTPSHPHSRDSLQAHPKVAARIVRKTYVDSNKAVACVHYLFGRLTVYHIAVFKHETISDLVHIPQPPFLS